MTHRPVHRDTRVLIIDDHALFAESLELALSLVGYDVRRPALPGPDEPADAALVAAIRMQPRIVLLDLDLGRLGDGTGMITPLARSGVHVVVVTASTDRARWGECLRHGARRVLAKTQPLNDVLAVVRRISQGLPVMDRHEREHLIDFWRTQRQAREAIVERLGSLTRREQEVLAHLMKGQPVAEIAALGVVSEATVRSQVKSILAKLEVSSQLRAVGMAHQVGWEPTARVSA